MPSMLPSRERAQETRLTPCYLFCSQNLLAPNPTPTCRASVQQAIDGTTTYSWPGKFCEMVKRKSQRAVVMCEEMSIRPRDLAFPWIPRYIVHIQHLEYLAAGRRVPRPRRLPSRGDPSGRAQQRIESGRGIRPSRALPCIVFLDWNSIPSNGWLAGAPEARCRRPLRTICSRG